MTSYLVAFVVAAVVAAVMTPLVRRMALRVGAVSSVGSRHVNLRQVPRFGGIAICIALFAPILGLFFVESSVARLFQENAMRVVGLCVGGVAMCLLGLADDAKGVRALHKLYGQLAVACLAFYCGYRIDVVVLPFIGELSMGIFALPVTVLWIVGIINAVNLIDGLDGLAGGVVFFAGITNLVVAYIAQQPFPALLMASLLGAVLGFLFYNFNPARIFMGDSGSYLLGFVLAVTGLVGASQKASTAVALLVPVVALGVPIFDTLLAIVRRFLERRPLFSPDRGHIHHRLIDSGITHKRAVLILYAISIVFTVSAIAIYLGRAWQIGVALLVPSVMVMGLVRFMGMFSQAHLLKRQAVRLRSRDTERLRKLLPTVPSRFSRCRTEDEILSALKALAVEAQLTHVDVRRRNGKIAEDAVLSWSDVDEDRRRVVASMTYPLGLDACARAQLTVAVVNDYEQDVMSPQSDILLQVIADVLAVELARVGSDLAPRQVKEAPEARESSPELAVKHP